MHCSQQGEQSYHLDHFHSSYILHVQIAPSYHYRPHYIISQMEEDKTPNEQHIAHQTTTGQHSEEGHCCEQHAQKGKVVVQPMPEEEKVKLETHTLGEQPFVIDPEEQEANFISCRLGAIAPDALQSSNLKVLLLRNNLIAAIVGLNRLPNLVQLQLYDNKIVKIQGLQGVPLLQVLDLSYNNIKKIQNLSHLKRLRKLFLLSNKIKKIENLELPELQMLELGSNKIKEIQNLEGVTSIKSLFLGKNRISEIKNLESLVNLEQIALGPNKLTSINTGLLPLRNTLRELYLQQNQITHIDNVNELERLEILDISYNAVEHLQNIDKLSRLECLYLNANKISEYHELQNLSANSKLTTISLFGNDVTKEPGYRMKLVELLPEIDDIDGTPMKTSYKIVFGSSKSVESQNSTPQ